MKVKEESKNTDLKLNIQKMKIMASGPITLWQIDMETVIDFIFLGSKITADGNCRHGIKIAGTNSNNLRYADDTTLTAESKEELKSP